MAFLLGTPVKNARADAITAQAGTGAQLQIWTTAYGTKLAQWTWTGNVWAAAAAGVLTFNAPTTNPVAGLATGTAAIAKLTKSDGTTAIIQDLTVGISASDVIVANTSIASGQNCTLTAFTVTEPA